MANLWSRFKIGFAEAVKPIYRLLNRYKLNRTVVGVRGVVKPLHDPSKLYPYETTIVLLFCASVSLVTIHSYLQSDTPIQAEIFDEAEAYLRSPLITVTVQGAVQFPGEYQVKRGSTVKELIQLATPLDTADLSKIKPHTPLRAKQRLRVPHRPTHKRKGLRNIPKV